MNIVENMGCNGVFSCFAPDGRSSGSDLEGDDSLSFFGAVVASLKPSGTGVAYDWYCL